MKQKTTPTCKAKSPVDSEAAKSKGLCGGGMTVSAPINLVEHIPYCQQMARLTRRTTRPHYYGIRK